MAYDRPRRPESEGDDDSRGRRYTPVRKVCAFCADKNNRIDYKEPDTLRRFITDRGKIRALGFDHEMSHADFSVGSQPGHLPVELVLQLFACKLFRAAGHHRRQEFASHAVFLEIVFAAITQIQPQLDCFAARFLGQ